MLPGTTPELATPACAITVAGGSPTTRSDVGNQVRPGRTRMSMPSMCPAGENVSDPSG
ncbi:hypothetical protein [Promicromonospora aerolata]|uniref:Uncharacterized protein n=1 Tax=Promicromonospora aerolata TaxID=195749 RepID=A0ABW4VAR5_9MICO